MLVVCASNYTQAATVLSDWTFETSSPTTAGPFAPEVGSGAASGFHAGASTFSSPSGNGSAHSFSSNTWASGDYYQFTLSTLGNSGISLSWDQTSSSTGPKDFALYYSTDGSNFTSVSTYSVQVNGTPNTAWNGTTSSSVYTMSDSLTSLSSLNNQGSVYFRLVDQDTTAENGGTVATAGTDRVDNFVVSASVTAVPLPATAWLLGGAFAALTTVRRRRGVSV